VFWSISTGFCEQMLSLGPFGWKRNELKINYPDDLNFS
jgi:hypothetical protein